MTLCLPPAYGYAGDFMIIVNKANPVTVNKNTPFLLKNLYLKKQSEWDNGFNSIPLSRQQDSDVQRAFLGSVLEMDQQDLNIYWTTQKSKSGTTPPRSVRSANALMWQISRKEGAWGIVSAEEAMNIPPGVKILTKFKHGQILRRSD